jgi:prepilin-type N-terminal cleavage/methylation domain-containing protein
LNKPHPEHPPLPPQVRCRGLSLIEVMMSLSITAMLLVATMAALDTSFRAYADASQQATVQVGTRLVTHRLLTLIRTSTAHGPLQPDFTVDPPITIDGDVLTSYFIELLDPRGRILRVEHRADEQQLWLIENPGLSTEQSQPLIDGVTAARFHVKRRINEDGLLVLERGSVDLTIQAVEDNTLAIEAGKPQPMRVIASTMPRKIE